MRPSSRNTKHDICKQVKNTNTINKKRYFQWIIKLPLYLIANKRNIRQKEKEVNKKRNSTFSVSAINDMNQEKHNKSKPKNYHSSTKQNQNTKTNRAAYKSKGQANPLYK